MTKLSIARRSSKNVDNIMPLTVSQLGSRDYTCDIKWGIEYLLTVAHCNSLGQCTCMERPLCVFPGNSYIHLLGNFRVYKINIHNDRYTLNRCVITNCVAMTSHQFSVLVVRDFTNTTIRTSVHIHVQESIVNTVHPFMTYSGSPLPTTIVKSDS